MQTQSPLSESFSLWQPQQISLRSDRPLAPGAPRIAGCPARVPPPGFADPARGLTIPVHRALVATVVPGVLLDPAPTRVVPPGLRRIVRPLHRRLVSLDRGAFFARVAPPAAAPWSAPGAISTARTAPTRSASFFSVLQLLASVRAVAGVIAKPSHVAPPSTATTTRTTSVVPLSKQLSCA